ncbi:CCA tRNA nucleotidyltransferase [Paenibacillus sp. N1-5-1-14]|uniref:CCA tRNA nucleotidyltransferase n=1 Tax=Paenibacillus radicibacter TaxID=2972488 RepID=UPI002158FF7D|nr:CCA tRNA nucleotidyltransferase [Paenibacillus radicibacter]MCR8642252.1 CCA tRNA nucleotidyltransferase [Paenibacillus radicibacter]
MQAWNLGVTEKAGRQVLAQLHASGYEAYFVGGCIRDACLGKPVKDIDIATSAKPEEVIACFERTVPTGLQHGTVTVLIDKQPFEVTTFRTETAYVDFRRPTDVQYVTNLEEDLQRRDFTMNAMALGLEGQIIDPFGGQQDLEAAILRCVGNPMERFGEDALRLLRCVRFAAGYQMQIEDETWEALCTQAPLLKHIAMERVRAELERLVGGESPERGLQLLLDSELLAYFRQDLGLPVATAWRTKLSAGALANLTALADVSARWSLLLLLTEEGPAAARHALRQLTFARAAGEEVVAVVALHDDFVATACLAEPASEVALAATVKLAAVRYGAKAAQRWLAAIAVLRRAAGAAMAAPSAPSDMQAAPPRESAPAQPVPTVDGAVSSSTVPETAADLSTSRLLTFLHTDACDLILASGNQWLTEMPCTMVSELAITGSDLMQAAGMKGGPWVGQLLHELLNRVAVGKLSNSRAQLIEAALVELKEKSE